MKKYLMAFVTVSLSLFLVCNLLYAESGSISKKTNIVVPLKLQIFEGEKPTEKFILGTLLIADINGRPEIFWDNVLVSPLHSQRKVLLKSEHTYSKYDLFEDVMVNRDSFSFTMVIGPQANRMRISGRKNEGEVFYSIKGDGVFKGIYPGDNPVKVEWKQVHKVILPYNEVH